MMNIDQINEYLEQKHSLENQNAETVEAKTEEAEVQETNTVEASQENTNNTGSNVENKEEVDTKPVETPPEDKTNESKENKPTPKKEYTKQEKIDYAFQKEKAKRKKLEARIKELEEENKKYKGLKLEDFKNSQEEYINYLVEQKSRENEKKRLENEYAISKNYEAEQINKARIAKCFPDEAEQEKYNNLVKYNGADFVKILDEADPEQVVLGFLDDSDVSPLLIRIMMTNKEYRDEILSKSSPYAKQRAMERLEEKVLWAKKQMENRKNKPVETKPVENKTSIPVVGSVTKSENTNGTVVKDYNSVLQQLNRQKHI